jgi:hypothetical protein
MAAPAPAEQRHERRQRVLKGASILTGVRNSEIRCTIRNQTESGAELQVAADSRIPPEFLLYVPADGVAYNAVLRWRRQNRAGVMFTGTQAKPRWHYG